MSRAIIILILMFLCNGIALASDTTTLSLPNSASSRYVVFHNKVWVAADIHGGVVCYDFHSKQLKLMNRGLEKLKTVTDIAVFKNNLFITHKFEGLFKLDTNSSTWVNCTPNGIARDSNFFTFGSDGSKLLVGGAGGRLYFTIDGLTWTTINTGFTYDINTIVPYEDVWFIGTSNSGLYKFDKTCKKLSQYSNLPVKTTMWGIVTIAAYKDNIYAVNYAESIITSEDRGTSWTVMSRDEPIKYTRELYHRKDGLVSYVPFNGVFALSGNTFIKDSIANKGVLLAKNEMLIMAFLERGVQFYCTDERIIAVRA